MYQKRIFLCRFGNLKHQGLLLTEASQGGQHIELSVSNWNCKNSSASPEKYSSVMSDKFLLCGS